MPSMYGRGEGGWDGDAIWLNNDEKSLGKLGGGESGGVCGGDRGRVGGIPGGLGSNL